MTISTVTQARRRLAIVMFVLSVADVVLAAKQRRLQRADA